MGHHSERWIPLGGFAVLLIAAWFSTGFQSADEHYQVIAFAEAKAGNQATSSLPWEYAAQIRSAFLPAVCWAVFGVARAAGVLDPFVLAFLLRLLTAVFAFGAVLYFVRSLRRTLPSKLFRPLLLLSFFLWFLPFLHVRFTGETWSGLFLLLALAPLLSGEGGRGRYLQCGIALGLAFLCRPPVLAAGLGIVAWLVVVQQVKLRHLLQLIIAFVLVLLAGIAIDSWFYGQFTLTAWNYLQLGVMGSAEHSFMEFPWWYYYAWVLKYSIPVFGILILLAFGLLCAFKPRHLLTWVVVPFLVLHMLLPHKELRFLFPLADLVPLMLLLAFQVAMERWPGTVAWFRRNRAAGAVFILAMATNLLALSVVISTPAGTGSAHLAARIRTLHPSGEVRINYLNGGDAVWRIRIPKFYLPERVSDTIVNTACIALAVPGERLDLLVSQAPVPLCPSAPNLRWAQVARSLPPWKQGALRMYEWANTRPVWKLYKPVFKEPRATK